jgi:hypothetical protein
LTFVWHSPSGEIVEWALNFPKEAKTPITASAILNVGDSMLLTFSEVDVKGTPKANLSLSFDGLTVPGSDYDAEKKTLAVPITTAMTAKPGHKEMTLTFTPPGTTKAEHFQLPFEVTKR